MLLLSQQIAAANSAANGDIARGGFPFYAEIGNAGGVLWSGSFGASAPTATTAMPIASASKFLYGAYCAQTMTLGATDWPFLNMSSGYHLLNGQCQANSTQTASQCLATTGPGGIPYDTLTPADVGKFYYDGGHFQHHGVNYAGLSADTRSLLGTAYQSALGVGAALVFTQPLLAGGVTTTAATYRTILQAVLSGTLRISSLLGTNTVPASTFNGALSSPAPSDEPWHYGPGHWIEPDGTFSSGGKYGFYPWINSTKTLYGIIARNDQSGSDEIGLASVRTGQSIRNAFITNRQRNPPRFGLGWLPRWDV